MKCVVAKKDHKCNVCDRLIPKGARYWRTDSNTSGMSNTFREHTNCLDFQSQPIVVGLYPIRSTK